MSSLCLLCVCFPPADRWRDANRGLSAAPAAALRLLGEAAAQKVTRLQHSLPLPRSRPEANVWGEFLHGKLRFWGTFPVSRTLRRLFWKPRPLLRNCYFLKLNFMQVQCFLSRHAVMTVTNGGVLNGLKHFSFLLFWSFFFKIKAAKRVF